MAIANKVEGSMRPHWPSTPKEAIHDCHWTFYLLSGKGRPPGAIVTGMSWDRTQNLTPGSVTVTENLGQEGSRVTEENLLLLLI